MKFEITSFVAAIVVYLVRLRVQHVSGTRPLYSASFLDDRSHLYMPDVSTSAQPEQMLNNFGVPEHSAMQAVSGYSSGIHDAAGFVQGCSRAV